ACPVQAFRIGSAVYATQFHPELDAAGLCTRIEGYKHAGYFEPAQASELKAQAHRSHVTHPPAILPRSGRRHDRIPPGTTSGTPGGDSRPPAPTDPMPPARPVMDTATPGMDTAHMAEGDLIASRSS